MSTFAASATQLAWRRDDTNWSYEGAMQGRYGSQGPRTGVMRFPTLRSVDWPNQAISKIVLKLTFDKVGTSAAKTISLYRGAKNTISGTGAQMRGESIGSIGTGGAAYSATNTVILSESSNASAFANLVDWLKNGATDTLVMYTGEASTNVGWSANYLRVTSAQMTVEYEIAGSSGELDKTEVEAGQPVTLSISPIEDAVTHDVVWSFGSKSETQSLAAGATETTFAPPLEWLEEIPAAMSGTAQCRLVTYIDGVERGSRVLPFTITVPEAAAPTFAATIAVSSDKITTARYYQYLTRAAIAMQDVSAKYGATIASYSIAGGEGSAGNAATLTTDYFKQPGLHSYTLRVTDSRGMTAEQAVSCEVEPVALPEVARFDVQRYTIDKDTGAYIRADYGDRVWVTLEATWDTVGGLNAATAYILYGPAGSTERTRATIDAGSGSISLTQDRSLIPVEIAPASAWVFELYLSDLANATGAADTVARGRCNVHFAGSGYGAAFGGFAKGTEEAPLLESYYPAQFYEGLNVDGELRIGGGLNDLVADQTETDFGAIASDTWAKVDAFVVSKPGLYLIGANASWQANSTGQRVIFVNAMSPDGSVRRLCATGYQASRNTHYQTCVTAAMLQTGDAVSIEALQGSGSALSTQVKYWAVKLR